MTEIPSTMTEQIEEMEDMEISYRTMHDNLMIVNNYHGKELVVPFSSIVRKYRHFLRPIIATLNLSPTDQRKYRFKPKSLSDDLYDTTEFWSELMVLNKAYSIAMFQPTKVKVYDPNRFKELLNEIMILEEEANDWVDDE